jgi:predicted nucleic acid-binding protein
MFVLDNSVAMRWLLASEKTTDQNYAEAVLKTLIDVDARVPSLWHLEAANVLLAAEKTGCVNTGEVESFIAHLDSLPLVVDAVTAQQAFNRTLALARAYKLSVYDAAYLELALREGLPLATLDKDLVKAAKKANVLLYLKT